MKAFKKKWEEFASSGTYHFKRDTICVGEYFWKAALEQILAKIDMFESDELNFKTVYDFIQEELKNE